MNVPVEELHAAVQEHGWLVVSGPLGPGLPEATTTVGLTARGLPELVVVGLDADTGGALLHELAGRITGGVRIADGAAVHDLVAGGADPCLDEALRPQLPLPARDLYGDDVVVRQLVWADAQGRLPGDPGFAHPELQPLLPGDPVDAVDDGLPREWPLALDPHTEVRSSRPVAGLGRPVLVVCRDDDGTFLFLDGVSDFVEQQAAVECLHDALERDLTLVEAVGHLEPGQEAERERRGLPWQYG